MVGEDVGGVCQRLERDSQGLTMGEGGGGVCEMTNRRSSGMRKRRHSEKTIQVQAAVRLPRKLRHRFGLKGDAAPPCGGVSRLRGFEREPRQATRL